MKDIKWLRMMGSKLRSAWACPTWAATGGVVWELNVVESVTGLG